MNIMITIPKTIFWDDYQKELDAVKNGDKILNFKSPSIPKNINKGDRCYVVHDGQIKGWMSVTGIMKQAEFKCEITGKEWKGNFIQRSGKFNYLSKSIEQKGFQGWRYFPDELLK